jgi:hypothetical protein
MILIKKMLISKSNILTKVIAKKIKKRPDNLIQGLKITDDYLILKTI